MAVVLNINMVSAVRRGTERLVVTTAADATVWYGCDSSVLKARQ